MTYSIEAERNHDRLKELGELLALGLQRALARKSSRTGGHDGESSLHILLDQSGHPTFLDGRASDA